MNDIIVSFWAWFTWLKELLKLLLQLFACLFPISLFLALCSIIFWFIKTFLSKIENQEGVENIEDEGENNLTLDNNDNEN